MADTALAEYLVERYEAGIAADNVRADARRLTDVVAAMQREGASIEFLGSTFLPTDEGVLSRFLSASQELVADAHGRAEVPFERIVQALPLEVEDPRSERAASEAAAL